MPTVDSGSGRENVGRIERRGVRHQRAAGRGVEPRISARLGYDDMPEGDGVLRLMHHDGGRLREDLNLPYREEVTGWSENRRH